VAHNVGKGTMNPMLRARVPAGQVRFPGKIMLKPLPEPFAKYRKAAVIFPCLKPYKQHGGISARGREWHLDVY